MPGEPGTPFNGTRGVVILPGDLTLGDWPERARSAGLTTVALHATSLPGQGVASLESFIRSRTGQDFLDACRRRGLEVEYELHAVQELLPRELYQREPGMFRMNDEGRRVPDGNLCTHSAAALEIAARNARAVGRVLAPTSGRHFLWGDDAKPWCRCPRCRELSDSDQALLVENRLLEALRADDPAATLAHLAYGSTLEPPAFVRPAPGVFLEYAPIRRRHDISYASQVGGEDGPDALDRNLERFDPAEAQVLEYWLDVSRYSGWRRPSVAIPWRPEVLASDLEAYGERGIRHITSFAAWIDADYLQRHGEPPIGQYGDAMMRCRASLR